MQGSAPAEKAATKRPRRKPGENRERLIEAGIIEFGIRGFLGASTAAIAALAEVPQPHVYANFHTKHELFLACAERVIEQVNDQTHTMEVDRFLLQLSAVAGSEVAGNVRQIIGSILSVLGEKQYYAALNRGAASLLH